MGEAERVALWKWFTASEVQIDQVKVCDVLNTSLAHKHGEQTCYELTCFAGKENIILKLLTHDSGTAVSLFLL